MMSDYRFHPRADDRKFHAPTWTLAEFAQEVGVDTLALVRALRRHKEAAPRPVVTDWGHKIRSNQGAVYRRKELREWWSKVNEA
jgi:hypothetical protein